MPREAKSYVQPSAYTPPSSTDVAGAWHVRVGGAALGITPHPSTGLVALELGIDDAEAHERLSGQTSANSLRSWSNALAMLTEARLAIQPADEVELRSPMLVIDGIGCMALWRLLGSNVTAMRLLVAPSPEALIAGEETAILFVTADEVRALVASLAAAASAALGAPPE